MVRYKNESYKKAFLSMQNGFSNYVSRNGLEISSIKVMAEWLSRVKREEVKSDSWRLYRAALLTTIELNPELWENDTYDKVKAILYEKTYGVSSKKQKNNTAKNLSRRDLEKISDELKSPKRLYGKSTLLWFKSSVLTGLRPNEWMNAEIVHIDDIECIKVKNFKVMEVSFSSLTRETSGRSRFLYRTIPLNGFKEDEVKVLRAWIVHLDKLLTSISTRLGIDKESAQKELYARCRKTLYAAYKAACPENTKSVALYTARHIFKVNNKEKLLASGMRKEQVDIYMAILMGHGSAKSNYAYGTGKADTDASTISIERLDEDKEIFLRRVLTRYD